MAYCQTSIIDQNLQRHKDAEEKAKKKSPLSRSLSNPYFVESIGESTPLFPPENQLRGFPMMIAPVLRNNTLTDSTHSQRTWISGASTRQKQTLRFQVVVWYVGQIDMVQGRIPMTFRVTVFWNDQPVDDTDHDDLDSVSVSSRGSSRTSRTPWQMDGRQRAYQKELTNPNQDNQEVEVPPVSILNVVDFDTIGSPEVSLLREDTRLMRWTCMYKATLVQDHWRVDGFPHDHHDITVKLAVLAHRLPGQQWDRNIYELALATEEDSQGSTRIPHGLVVDNMTIPEFMYNKEQGLSFGLVPLNHGAGGTDSSDVCLEVTLKVLRESGYYDNNIFPLIALLNLVAVSTLFLEPANFFQRALLLLNIAFVEIGIRMTTDSHLPNVSYQIKMQKILNEYFCWVLLGVFEGNLVYLMHRAGSPQPHIIYVDLCFALLALAHNAYTIFYYYSDAYNAKAKLYGKYKYKEN